MLSATPNEANTMYAVYSMLDWNISQSAADLPQIAVTTTVRLLISSMTKPENIWPRTVDTVCGRQYYFKIVSHVWIS